MPPNSSDREARLLDMLRESPKTLTQLVAQRLLHPPGHDSPWVDAAEARTISQRVWKSSSPTGRPAGGRAGRVPAGMIGVDDARFAEEASSLTDIDHI